jgi:hypothetical protein
MKVKTLSQYEADKKIFSKVGEVMIKNCILQLVITKDLKWMVI